MANRKPRRRRGTATDSAVTSLLDVFLLSLMLILASRPEFGLEEIRIPELMLPRDTVMEPAATAGMDRLELLPDGSVRWRQEAVSLDSVAKLIAAEPDQDQDIQFLIHTTSDRKMSQELLTLLATCSQQGVWKRMVVQYVRIDEREQQTEGG